MTSSICDAAVKPTLKSTLCQDTDTRCYRFPGLIDNIAIKVNTQIILTCEIGLPHNSSSLRITHG